MSSPSSLINSEYFHVAIVHSVGLFGCLVGDLDTMPAKYWCLEVACSFYSFFVLVRLARK